MDNILFVDTSIFIQENFLEGTRINTLLDLCARGHYHLMFSVITVKEIKGQFKKQVRAAITKHNTMLNEKKHDVRVLRNNSKGSAIIQKLPNEKAILPEFYALLEQRLNDAGAEILDYTAMDIAAVFEAYFNGEAPFGSADKKHEFPDAFAFQHMEQWCAGKGIKATFLTRDKDFLKKDSPYFTVIYEYEKFIEDKLKDIEARRIERLETLYASKSIEIDEKAMDWLRDQFDNDTNFDELTNWMDIHDIDVQDISVVSKEYEIIAIGKENIEIEVTAVLSYKLELEIDDAGTGIYDNETGDVIFADTVTLELTQTNLEIPLKISFEITEPDDYSDEIDIIEINNSKDVTLRPDGWEDHYGFYG